MVEENIYEVPCMILFSSAAVSGIPSNQYDILIHMFMNGIYVYTRYTYMIPVSGFLTPPPTPPQCDDPVHTTHCSNDYNMAASFCFEGELAEILEHLFMPNKKPNSI